MQWQGEVGEGFNRKVFPQWWGGGLPAPVKGEVARGEAYREVLDWSWAVKAEREEKDCGCLAEAGLA